MNVVRHTDRDFRARLGQLCAPSSLFDSGIEQRTRAILEEVQVRGDDAVLEFTENFDGAKLAAEQLAVTQAELFNASLDADESAARGRGRGGEKHRRFRQEIPAQKLADPKNSHGATWAKNSIRSSAWAFTSPAAPRRWFRPR